MNERTTDVIVWGGFPHPDPVMRHAPVSVQLPPPLWRRVLHHLSVQDAAWAAWLGEAAVNSLRDALQRDLAHDAPRGEGPLSIPATVLEAIHATLRASFWQPMAIWFGNGEAKSDGYYRLILTNGAIAVLRPSPADPSRLTLEDLFFTRSQTTGQAAGEARRRQAVLQTMDRYAKFDPARGQFKTHATRHITHTHTIRFVDPRIWNDLPATDSPADCLTSLEIAERIGFDQLFDDAAGSGPAPISTATALLAARELQQQLSQWTDAAITLSSCLEDATEAYRDEICLSLLESRMSAWAGFLAIDEAYSNAIDSNDLNPELTTQIDSMMAAMESFDEALQAAEVFWAPVAHRTELLKNCEARLAGAHRLSLPWWMNATPSGARVRTAYYRLG